MTETIIFYQTASQREQNIATQKALGFWILHDDFNILDVSDGIIKNRLTFTNVETVTAALKSLDTYVNEFIDTFPSLNTATRNTLKDKLKRITGALPLEPA